MEIICDECQSKFRIQDEKIPPDKTVTLACPKCKNKISVSAPKKEAESPQSDFVEEDAVENESEDSSFDPFDDDSFEFVEEEGETALVCEEDADLRTALKDGLVSLEYYATETDNLRDALKKLRYHTYDMVIVNEKFGGENTTDNSVLIYLQRLPMGIRRNIFVALISDNLRTKDDMAAFNKSVNLIINKKNLSDFSMILKRAVTENDLFFKIFRETLKDEGRI